MAREVNKNKLTIDRDLTKINPENKLLLRDFISYLHSIDRAETTIYEYKKNLEGFFVYNMDNNRNKGFTEITKRDFLRFQEHAMRTWKWSPSRIRGVKATISSLSNYIENFLDEEYPGYHNVISNIVSPSLHSVLSNTVFTEDELQKLLDHLVENGRIRQAAALALAMYSGRRKSELTRFKVSHFKDENVIYDSLWKTDEKIKTKGRGFHGKQIPLYVLKDKFKPYLDLLLEDRKKHGIKSEWLLTSYKFPGKQCSVDMLNDWADEFTKILGKNFYWHSMRHYFTTMLIQQNVPIDIIQDMVNWDSASMLRIYSDVSLDANLGKFFAKKKIK